MRCGCRHRLTKRVLVGSGRGIVGIDRSKVSHHDPIAISKDGKFSIEFAECLASCGTGPVCLVGDDFHEEVTPERVGELLEKYD